MIDLTTGQPWNGTIVLVSDPVDASPITGPFDRRIDRPQPATVNALAQALKVCCDRLVIFSDLNTFTARIGQHAHSLVFPYWFGQVSRSRHALVPAICEANRVMFVGADAFVKVVCNDKELSKAICRQAGLSVPASAIVRRPEDLAYAQYVGLPVVVKPNYEGTSLGITQRNLCRTWKEVDDVARELLEKLSQPLIIEEFVPGREFSACMMARGGDTIAVQIGSWKIDGQSDYLDNRINSYELKLPNDIPFEFELITDTFTPELITAMEDCFCRLGKVDLLRIDGRLSDKNVSIVELTPDIYLGEDGEFCLAFAPAHAGYAEFISRVVGYCLERYKAHVPVR